MHYPLAAPSDCRAALAPGQARGLPGGCSHHGQPGLSPFPSELAWSLGDALRAWMKEAVAMQDDLTSPPGPLWVGLAEHHPLGSGSCQGRERDALFAKVILLILWKGNPSSPPASLMWRHHLVSLQSFRLCPCAWVQLAGLAMNQARDSLFFPRSVYWCYHFLSATVSQFLLQTVSAAALAWPWSRWAPSLSSPGKGQYLHGGLWILQIPALVMWGGINLWP